MVLLFFFILPKVHVSTSSSVSDHCRTYALSYLTDKDYTSTCDHSHEDRLDRCVRLASVVGEIEDALQEAECPSDTREELVFIASQAKKHINSWKSHLLRSLNQDECRLDIIKELDETSVLLVLDWGYEISSKEISRKSV